jgi:F0F1-type ATP synthase assembly protein I
MAVSYLIGGMAVWGLIGWLVDRQVHGGGVVTAIGIVLGMAGGVYLVARRMKS